MLVLPASLGVVDKRAQGDAHDSRSAPGICEALDSHDALSRPVQQVSS